MIEVNAVDRVLVLIQREVTADAAPQTGTFELEHKLGLPLNLGYIHGMIIDIQGILNQRVVQLSGIACREVLLQCAQNLLLLVKAYVRLLTRAEQLANQSQHYSYDNHYYRSIYNRIGIAIRVHIVML